MVSEDGDHAPLELGAMLLAPIRKKWRSAWGKSIDAFERTVHSFSSRCECVLIDTIELVRFMSLRRMSLQFKGDLGLQKAAIRLMRGSETGRQP